MPVKAGDFLIAIDGVEVKAGDNVFAQLVDKADRMVTLTTNTKPTAKGAVTTRVRTLCVATTACATAPGSMPTSTT